MILYVQIFLHREGAFTYWIVYLHTFRHAHIKYTVKDNTYTQITHWSTGV